MSLISRVGYERLKKELKKIDKEMVNTQIAMGESAKKDNDLRENPEYMDLRVKLMYTLPKEKEKILSRLENAIIIEETSEFKNFDGKIIPGTIVEVIFDDVNETYKILGDDEATFYDDEYILSCNAPIAKSLLGKKNGDEIEFNNFKIAILSVKRSDD